MKSLTLIFTVCVALTAAAVFKRDTKTGTPEIDWQGAKQHIDDMFKLFKDQVGTANEILGKSLEQTKLALSDFTEKANSTLSSYGPEVQGELKAIMANVQATGDKLSEAVKDNTPDMYNSYLAALEGIKNQTEKVSATLSPQVEEAKRTLAGLQQQLVKGFTSLLEEASKQLKKSE